jgi:hypothetical protein
VTSVGIAVVKIAALVQRTVGEMYDSENDYKMTRDANLPALIVYATTTANLIPSATLQLRERR